MLAKVWKKALLAVCIIACIYNVMYKLVSRTSLELQLRSVQNPTSLTSPENVENDDKSTSNLSETNKENANDVEKENDNNDSIVVIY